MDAKHTQTPWYCEPDKGIEGHWTIWADIGGMKTFIADCYEGPEDAAHIVRAVNSFDDMLEALRLADDVLIDHRFTSDMLIIQKIRAAIAKAEGRTDA